MEQTARDRRARVGIVAAAGTAAVLLSGVALGGVTRDDVLTVGNVNVLSGTGTVSVPLFIQDNTGTAIGRDRPAGKRITSFAVQVTYGANACIDTPAGAAQRIDLAGSIPAGQSADLDSRAKVANTSQSWIFSSAERNGLIPFTAAAPPGDLIGKMVFNLTGCPAGRIDLVVTVSGAAAALVSSEDNTTETSGNGLQVVNGSINVASGATPANVPTLDATSLGALALFLAAAGLFLSKRQME